MPIIEADYSTTLSSNLTATGTTFDVSTPPTLTEGCLVLNRGQENEEWVYMSSVSSSTITVSHRGLSKTTGTLTEVTANKKVHYAGETVEWVNHPVHIINKRGDTIYGDITMDGTEEIRFNSSATAIWKDGSGNLSLKDASAGTKTLSNIATTSTKLDDFATPDDNTDLDATTGHHGLLPKLDGSTSVYLRGDGDWGTPAGAGNVSTSDVTATDNAIVREDGTSGTQVQKSLVTIDDSGSINIPSGQTYKINGTALKDVTETLTNKTLTSPVINTPTGIVKGDVGLGNVTNNAQVKKIGSSTDNAIIRWDGTSGDTPQDSDVTIDDSGIITPLRPEQNSSEPSSPTLGQLYYDISSGLLKYYSGWNIEGFTSDAKSIDVSSQESSGRSIAFSSDGTKMYVVGLANDTVYQYTLSTAWDVSTASYASKSADVSSQEGEPYGLAFSADGTKMYIVGNISQAVNQYTLSTAWDVSTASYASKSADVSSEDTYPGDVQFNLDGTKMYVFGDTNDKIFQYTLSTAWDVSTASYASKSADVISSVINFCFSSDGSKFYFNDISEDILREYYMTIPWDISTAYDTGRNASTFTGRDFYGIFAKPDGSKIYMINSGDDVRQYSFIDWKTINIL